MCDTGEYFLRYPFYCGYIVVIILCIYLCALSVTFAHKKKKKKSRILLRSKSIRISAKKLQVGGLFLARISDPER